MNHLHDLALIGESLDSQTGLRFAGKQHVNMADILSALLSGLLVLCDLV